MDVPTLRLCISSAFAFSTILAQPVLAGLDACDPAGDWKAKTKASFEAASAGDRQSAVSAVVEILDDCGDRPLLIDDLYKQGVNLGTQQAWIVTASILGSTMIPWIATEPDKVLTQVYTAFKKSTNPAESVVLNAALMNSQGFYRQALNEYSAATPDNDEYKSVRGALERTLEKFPDSPNYDDAKFLLAQLFVRELVFMRITQKSGLRTEAVVLEEARKYLGELVNAPKADPPKYTLYAHWNLALLALLTGDSANSNDELERMKQVYEGSLIDDKLRTWNHTLYYYHPFLFSKFPVIDNHIAAIQLYDRWKETIASWPTGTVFTDKSGLELIAAEIRKAFINTSTYFVALGSFPTRSLAEAGRNQLAKSSSFKELVIYPPWPERNLYTIGTPLQTLGDARKTLQASQGILPKGAPIMRFY
ncbi:MAG: hypothetical protein K9G48_00620 [Reyranella sp.]|nr:hypothetical protein [Reyranella sp.]